MHTHAQFSPQAPDGHTSAHTRTHSISLSSSYLGEWVCIVYTNVYAYAGLLLSLTVRTRPTQHIMYTYACKRAQRRNGIKVYCREFARAVFACVFVRVCFYRNRDATSDDATRRNGDGNRGPVTTGVICPLAGLSTVITAYFYAGALIVLQVCTIPPDLSARRSQ